MTTIITGDIINSRKIATAQWLPVFKSVLDAHGKTPQQWQLYRGDEFQIEIANTEEVLMVAIQIKALLKTIKLDARMSIGIGDKSYSADQITQSSGTAFIRSGELFQTLKKEKITLAVNSQNADFDMEMNLILRLISSIMNNWLPQSAEFVLNALRNPTLSQEEIGQQLGITQAAVSRRQKRSQFDLIMDVDAFFRYKINQLKL